MTRGTVVSGKHLRKISNWTALQSADNAEKEQRYQQLETISQSLKGLAKMKYDREHKDSL